MASSTPIFLKDERIRVLAQRIRNHEVNNFFHVVFANQGEQFQNLRMCNNNVASVNTLLDECNLLVIRYKDDPVRGPIANQILAYAEHCLNNALQLVRNFTVRSSYLEKMADHFHKLFEALEELKTSSDSDVLDFTQTIEEYDIKVVSYMWLNLNSHASAQFSRWIRNVGIGLDELVRRHQVQLGFGGRFEDLTEEQKLEVYALIIEASGRLSILTQRGDQGDLKTSSIIAYRPGTVSRFGSAAMFIYDVGLIIWDVFSSNQPITTALRESLVLAAATGGAAVGKLVGTAIAIGLTGAAATSLFVMGAGLIVGIIGGFIFGAMAGSLFDRIVGSGGQAVLPTDGFVMYVAPMPNGHELARLM